MVRKLAKEKGILFYDETSGRRKRLTQAEFREKLKSGNYQRGIRGSERVLYEPGTKMRTVESNILLEKDKTKKVVMGK